MKAEVSTVFARHDRLSSLMGIIRLYTGGGGETVVPFWFIFVIYLSRPNAKDIRLKYIDKERSGRKRENLIIQQKNALAKFKLSH